MQHRIIVLGGGYAGATAAGRLAKRLRREDVALTLVNDGPDFVERVRLHQLAAGQTLVPRPFEEMFAGTGVATKHARVTGIDVDRRTVSVTGADGTEQLPYDSLVYALGSGWDDQGVPGVAEHSQEIASRPGAQRVRERLTALGAGAPVVVVGGGLTGLEAATEIAESRPDLDVSLVARGGLGDWLSPKGRGHLEKVCARLGITVHERTDVTAVHADRVETAGVGAGASGGEGVESAGAGAGADAAGQGVLRSELTVWNTGFGAHPLARETALEVSPTGQIVVDRTMRSLSHPDVYAIGDAAEAAGPGGRPLRMSCASGVPMSWQAADALAARLTGRKVPEVPIRYFNLCVSLGRKDGLIQYVDAEDHSVSAALTGRFAAFYKEIVCKGAAWGVAHPTLGLPVRRHGLVSRASVASGIPATETVA